MRARLPVLAAVATLSCLAATLPALQAQAASGPPDGIVVKDGVTQPVFPYDQAITESVFIETPVDSDGDGAKDRVHALIQRPGATAGALKVASLVEPSPYWAGILDVPNHGVDVDELPQAARDAKAATSRGISLNAAAPPTTREYYVTRGYAYIRAESIGSGASDGCPTTGDANETLAMKAVVDWLTGRAPGFTKSGEPARATWSIGSVGMIGASYNGTLPNQVATTGVRGLKTIVPIAAISSWYDYYRANGLVVAPGGFQGEDADVLARAVLTRANPNACKSAMDRIELDQDRVTGDYTKFWRDRDYLPGARNVKASVFVTHGLNDWNVKTTHFAQWWDALGDANVKRRLWLHPGGHSRPSIDAWRDAVHRWIDHYLYDIRNGAQREKPVTVERTGGATENYSAWPDARTRDVSLRLTPGTLSTWSRTQVKQSFVDAGATRPAEELVKRPQTADPNRLAYRTWPLIRDARLSGTPRIDLRAAVQNRTAANLTALLVDYSPDGTVTIVSRGWTDARNRRGAQHPRPVEPGRYYSFRWEQEPKDHVFAEGHRIGLVVISTDHHYTLRPKAGTGIGVDLGRSRFELPIVGGRLAF